MEAIIDHHQQQDLSSGQSSFSSSIQDQDHQAAHVVVDYDLLLEESWFFGNLLINQKPIMSRCFSDPSPSSITNISNEIIALTTNNTTTTRNLARTPSLPPNIGREEEEDDDGHLNRVVTKLSKKAVEPNEVCCLGKKKGSQEKKKSSSSSSSCRSKTITEPRKNMLVRTQTLPTSMRKVEIVMSQDQEEINGGIRKPSRQASLNLADILPPRHNKGTSNSRNRAPKNTGVEFDTDGSREMRRRYQNGKNMRRSLSDLEIEEVQGFKDLGFTFDNKDKLNPSVVNIIPGLQEKKEEDNMGLENKVRRPYLSEAWLTQSYGPPPPPPPSWALRKSSQDMKAHIKFWARAVASNVHQEC
ncbi:uncharacterized protein LOC133802075 [Humulus lupulus]|uniref:uncharacterized protein LOC133802075 n=1 Tax=Humulus lupulus TaxID=3486 RepID=UPI002B41413F|nr:uncharacterized protein LOC133802075 [Humulus lupulus]